MRLTLKLCCLIVSCLAVQVSARPHRVPLPVSGAALAKVAAPAGKSIPADSLLGFWVTDPAAGYDSTFFIETQITAGAYEIRTLLPADAIFPEMREHYRGTWTQSGDTVFFKTDPRQCVYLQDDTLFQCYDPGETPDTDTLILVEKGASKQLYDVMGEATPYMAYAGPKPAWTLKSLLEAPAAVADPRPARARAAAAEGRGAAIGREGGFDFLGRSIGARAARGLWIRIPER